MRTAFIQELARLAERDPRITFITGDLGFSVIEGFAASFPLQFLNVGVAEQNMTGVAAGMALCGKIVFTYSIANFPTIRCLEQVRNDVCYHQADVKIVAVGGGLAYGPLGYSHHAIEDLAIMRSLPNVTVVAPGDPVEAAAATAAIAYTPGPCYLRLGKAGEATCHRSGISFEIGRAIKLLDGHDLTLISIGGMLPTALEVAGRLDSQGIEVRVLSMHTLKPLDDEAIVAAATETGAIVTLEEHSVVGGLGSAVAETLTEHPAIRAPLKRIGLPSACTYEVGSHEYLKDRYGLSADTLADSIAAFVLEQLKPRMVSPLRARHSQSRS